ncbi:uncharacterized protein LOC129289602 [Prosopis cineraria]|uniref:uncharacterized protein LOC129289602 n=1 Tax=Prosopis cineraria TaxID=364024 RepID=UPI002410950D|nr:uncharacterized protein LOC129289602 [Prosopis cineraria]
MESNLPVISKRAWSIVRVVFFMLRKRFAKAKLLMDLNLMLKRPGKIAGKAIANLISLHHHGSFAAYNNDASLHFSTAREYEFSCGNTPNYSFFSKRRHPLHLFDCAHTPLTLDDDAVVVNNALKKALEMLDDNKYSDVAKGSPALTGFGRTPAARQMRVTDSPFPVKDGNDEKDDQVDEAAEEFINRFYRGLKKQC